MPPIVPLVVYNGQTRWLLPRRFSDGLATPLAAGLALDFPIHVFDLGLGDEMQLSALPWLRGRFGPLPEEVRKRAASASISQLEHWLDRSVDASSLSEAVDRAEH